jgi:putative mRNA 3-end processing factor
MVRNADSDGLVRLTEHGLYCATGGFYVDPWRAVERAIVTHAHSDHARWGCGRYLAAREGEWVLRQRLGPDAIIKTIPYGETLDLNGVQVSLHPAGHILGSAQVRIEYRGEVWVISGDYKVEPDGISGNFEPIRCHTFVTESTFGLPIYRWPPQSEVFATINAWWRANQQAGKASLLMGYALGKAQRMIAGVDPSIGPICTHGSVENFNRAYRESGVVLPETIPVATAQKVDWSKALIVAPESTHGTPWTRRFGPLSTGFASGWMRIRGTRRRRAMDRGFVLSDHADWPGLMETIKATGAERVWATHGYSAVVARWLREQGYESLAIQTYYEAEEDTEAADDSTAE